MICLQFHVLFAYDDESPSGEVVDEFGEVAVRYGGNLIVTKSERQDGRRRMIFSFEGSEPMYDFVRELYENDVGGNRVQLEHVLVVGGELNLPLGELSMRMFDAPREQIDFGKLDVDARRLADGIDALLGVRRRKAVGVVCPMCESKIPAPFESCAKCGWDGSAPVPNPYSDARDRDQLADDFFDELWDDIVKRLKKYGMKDAAGKVEESMEPVESVGDSIRAIIEWAMMKDPDAFTLPFAVGDRVEVTKSYYKVHEHDGGVVDLIEWYSPESAGDDKSEWFVRLFDGRWAPASHLRLQKRVDIVDEGDFVSENPVYEEGLDESLPVKCPACRGSGEGLWGNWKDSDPTWGGPPCVFCDGQGDVSREEADEIERSMADVRLDADTARY